MPQARRAFTLIEILVVCTVMMILAGIVVTRIWGRTTEIRIKATRTKMEMLKSAINEFESHAARYPTSQEGLEALVQRPDELSSDQWPNRYLDDPVVPVDEFGTAFRYIIPADTGYEFELVSAGPDKKFDTADDLRLSDRWTRRNNTGRKLADGG